MILPTTYAVTLLLMIVSMLCWGSWANTFKLTKKWRFELFYFDYAFGVLLAAVIAALTFGSMGEGLSFVDNMTIAGKKYMLMAFGAGAIFNLANMLLVAAISLAGLAVAFPIGIGLALVIGVIWNYFLNPQGNPYLLFCGVLLVVGAIIVDARAYREHGRKAGTSLRFNPRGVILSLVSGLLMGSFYPLVEMSKVEEVGLGAYAVAVIFAVGVFLSTLVFNLYFINLPVQGNPVPLSDYISQGTVRNHALGCIGGMIWCAGAVTNFAAASAPKEVNAGPAISYALGQGATLISVLWGLLVWKEFRGATPRVNLLLVLMIVLFIVGLGLVSIAPLFGK